jgi:hypothetical protein
MMADIARVYSPLRPHLVRQQHRHRAEEMAGVFLQEQFAHAQFVQRVDDAVGERHHQGFGALVDQRAQLCAHVVVIDRHQHRAVVTNAFAHRADERCRHQRIGTPRARHVVLPFERQAIAVAAGARQRHGAVEAGRDQQADARPAPLDERVGAERGGIAHRIDPRQQLTLADAELSDRELQRFVETGGEVVMGGERLGLHVAPGPGHEAVGEGAADVDRHAIHVTAHAQASRPCT